MGLIEPDGFDDTHSFSLLILFLGFYALASAPLRRSLRTRFLFLNLRTWTKELEVDTEWIDAGEGS